MKKFLVLILAWMIVGLTAVSTELFTQDTCKYYIIKGMDFSKVDTIFYLCDTVKEKPLGQGVKESQDTVALQAEMDSIAKSIQNLSLQLENSYTPEQRNIHSLIKNYQGIYQYLFIKRWGNTYK